MRAPSVGTLGAIAALCFLAVVLWPASSPEEAHLAHRQHRQLQAFTFATRTTFPSQLDDTDEWIHYGIYVGIVAAVFILVGLIVSITLCIGFCCRRCCCNFSKNGSKACWSILFAVVFVIICLCAVCVVAFSAAMTTGVSKGQKSADTFVKTGVPGAFDDVKDQLAPLPSQVVGIISDTVNDILNDAFSPVDDLVNFADAKLIDADNVLVSASKILNDTDDQFALLRALFTRLAAYSNIVKGIPSNDTVPDVRALTATTLTDGRTALNDMRNQILNLSTSVESAKSEVSMNSPTVQDAIKAVNDSLLPILNSIDDAKKSFVDLDISENYIHKYDNYIALQNKIRLPVMIVLAVLPVIMSGLWILGATTSKRRLMLVGFWWAAGVCWLILLLGAVHVVLFIPIKDACQSRNEVITSAATQFYFNEGTSYAATIGITSPAEAANAVNDAVAKFLGNPNLILECDGDASLVTQLGIDLPGAFGIRSRMDNITAEIQQQVNNVNIASKIADAQPTFASMDERVQSLYSNVTVFNGTLGNYTTEYETVRANFVPTDYWNASTQAKAQQSLDSVNNVTQNTVPSDTWEFTTIQNMNVSHYVLLTQNQRNQLNATKQAILAAVQLNNSVSDVEDSLNEYSNITVALQSLLLDSTELIVNTSNLVIDSWARVNASVTLPQQILDSVLSYLNPAIDKLIQLAQLDGLGKCKFVGDFVRTTWSNALCRDVGAASGVVAIAIFILGMTWLISWPIILSSKTFFLGGYRPRSSSVVDNDLWSVEMEASKRYA